MANHTTPMTPVDAAWYHIDGPLNLAQVTGVLLTRTPLDYERVRDVYRSRLDPFPRFRQRVVEQALPIGPPRWEDVPHFDIGQHVHHVALPAPADHATLVAFLSRVASTPLNRERPLWHVDVVDGVAGGSALVMRFHHCMGDGTAMMALAQELFDTVADAPIGRPRPPRSPSPASRGLLDDLATRAAQAVDWSTKTFTSGLDLVRHPSQLVAQAGTVLDGASMLLGELLKSPDPETPFKGEFGPQKAVAWSEPVALADIKTIGSRWGAKVNDVLVAGITGALRGYLLERGVDAGAITLRAMVPVDLRPRERALELGNEFGLVILELAVGADDPLERLRRTKTHMDALKRSPEALAIMTLFNIFGRGPKVVEDFAVDLFSSKASVVLTNVAGPTQPLYLAGVPIDRFMFWVPHPGRQLGMGISILSYAGAVSMAVIADGHLVPDPAAITARFNREFEALLALARQPA